MSTEKENITPQEAAFDKEQPKAETKAKAKAPAKPKLEPGGALAAVGREACRLHNLERVWVTEDGQCFPIEGDARAHAANLKNKELIKVTAR